MREFFIKIFFLSAAFLTLPHFVQAANYPLEIIQPRAGLNTTNRFYKAYPGLDYNVRAAVIGGVYPYTYSLTTKPTGMTINSSTGEIDWPNPTTSGSPFNVALHVVDSENNSQDVSWTITVTTNGFHFIDAINGNNSNAGTVSEPWQTMGAFYLGAKWDDTHVNDFIYFRSGAYQTTGTDLVLENGNRLTFVPTVKPVVFLAYPGESPLLDLSTAHIMFDSGGSNVYLDGFEVYPMSPPEVEGYGHYGFQINGNISNVTVRNCNLHGLDYSYPTNLNQAAILVGWDHDGQYWSISDNIFHDITTGYVSVIYGADYGLFEDNIAYDLSDTNGIALKDSSNYWTIRHNRITGVTGGSDSDGINISAYNGRTVTGIEVCFNYVVTEADAEASIVLNTSLESNVKTTYIYRNTCVGKSILANGVAGSGPITINNNVIQSDTPYISGDLTTVTDINNLKGATGLVDPNGLLINRNYVGTYGWEIPNSDTTPPSAPAGLSVS